MRNERDRRKVAQTNLLSQTESNSRPRVHSLNTLSRFTYLFHENALTPLGIVFFCIFEPSRITQSKYHFVPSKIWMTPKSADSTTLLFDVIPGKYRTHSWEEHCRTFLLVFFFYMSQALFWGYFFFIPPSPCWPWQGLPVRILWCSVPRQSPSGRLPDTPPSRGPGFGGWEPSACLGKAWSCYVGWKQGGIDKHAGSPEM